MNLKAAVSAFDIMFIVHIFTIKPMLVHVELHESTGL